MTTAGLQVKNDILSIQIDQDYKNLALVYKATITTDTLLYAVSPYSSYKTITLPVGVVNPVIAFSCGEPCLIMDQTDTVASLLCRGAVGTSITYFVFGEPPTTAPAHGEGLLVFTASGQVGYDTNFPYLRRLQSLTTASSSLNGGAGTIGTSSTFSGKTLAVVQNAGSFAQHTDGGSGGAGAVPATAYGAGVATFGTFAVITCFKVFGFNASAGWHQDGPNGAWLMIDVTGY